MDRQIEVKVSGNHLWKDGNLAGVQGEGNITRLRITFDEGWAGFAKSITFFDARGKNPVKINLTVDLLEDIAASTMVYLCAIPPEPLVYAGWCSFVIEGYIDDVRQRAVETKMEVLPAKDTTGANDPAAPTPTQAEQLQVQMEAVIGDLRQSKTGLRVLDYFDTLELLESAVQEPTAGDAYAVGMATPYDIYIYSPSKGWVNNGQLQGAVGDPGKDATINGENALTIKAGDGFEADQKDGVLTIKAKTVEEWVFTLEDDSEVTKKVVLV